MLVLRALVLVAIIHSALSTPSTTPHIPEVFLGKCFTRNPVGVDCNALYDAFSSAAQRDNFNSSDAEWDNFFALSSFATPKDAALFWSGNMNFAVAVSTSDTRFYSMEETSTGYIINNLLWCGTANNSYDYTGTCYFPSNATYYGTQGVWTRASAKFAQGVSGHAYILLAPVSIGGTPPVYNAFRNTSIFSTTELPNTIPGAITNFTILVLRNTTLAPDEVCGKGSLVVLHERIKEQLNISANCIDDPTELFNLLCPPGAQLSAQCQAAALVYQYEGVPTVEEFWYISHETWAIVMTVAFGVAVLIVIALTVRLCSVSKKYEKIRN